MLDKVKMWGRKETPAEQSDNQEIRASLKKIGSDFILKNCGGGEIRTHDTLPGMTVFKTVAFSRSATPPVQPTVATFSRCINFLYASLDDIVKKI